MISEDLFIDKKRSELLSAIQEEIVFTKRGLGTFITESTAQIEELRYKMAKNQISTFIEGMMQIGYTKEEMIKFIERENNNSIEGIE